MPTKSLRARILSVLQQNPDGLDIYQIRSLLPDMGHQQHLDRRVRELEDKYILEKKREKGRTIYILKGPRPGPQLDTPNINQTLRAKILNLAHGRCQMCGKTVSEDHVRLQIDHKIPRTWGGSTTEDNLWAICELCNNGKRNYFATFDQEMMTKILAKDTVYERLAETMQLMGETPSWLLAFVANAGDYQDDWQKRLRELRYPGIDFVIKVKRKKNENGKVEAQYILEKGGPLPPNFLEIIRERNRGVFGDDDSD